MCEKAQHTSISPLAGQLINLYLKSDENSDNPNKLIVILGCWCDKRGENDTRGNSGL